VSSITTVSDAPSSGITYDLHFDNLEASFTIEEHILDTNAGKTIVLSHHRCLINTAVEKINNI
jgi:hypothetical protein